jgi:hypothetical protein
MHYLIVYRNTPILINNLLHRRRNLLSHRYLIWLNNRLNNRLERSLRTRQTCQSSHNRSRNNQKASLISLQSKLDYIRSSSASMNRQNRTTSAIYARLNRSSKAFDPLSHQREGRSLTAYRHATLLSSFVPRSLYPVSRRTARFYAIRMH